MSAAKLAEALREASFRASSDDEGFEVVALSTALLIAEEHEATKATPVPLPHTDYALWREARPYESDYLSSEPGYSADDMRAYASAALAAHEAEAKAAPEPVAWIDVEEDGSRHGLRSWSDGSSRERALVFQPAAPVNSPAPLTDEQIAEAVFHLYPGPTGEDVAELCFDHDCDVARAIERAHKIGVENETI